VSEEEAETDSKKARGQKRPREVKAFAVAKEMKIPGRHLPACVTRGGKSEV